MHKTRRSLESSAARLRVAARRALAFALVASLAAGSLAPAAGEGEPGAEGFERSPLERMKLERLEAANADVRALHARRRTVGLSAGEGLTDIRAIFHAHAEDSQHTGGTLPEMLEDARAVGVSAIFLSNHFRPPQDYVEERRRGMKDGVLLLPGSETHGMLILPERSIMEHMDKPPTELAAVVTEGDGLAFLCHPELHPADTTEGLTGTEIYNNHADAMEDITAMMGLMGRMADPVEGAKLSEGLARFPQEMFAALVDYPAFYLQKWDRETQARRAVGVAANDCHHNQIYLVQVVDAETVRIGTNVDPPEKMRTIKAVRPALKEALKDKQPGDTILRLDFDPYRRSFMNVSTHILLPELTEAAARKAVKAGRCYVSHDWLTDPTGFAFVAERAGERVAIMGDEVELGEGLRLRAEAPLETRIRLIANGEVVHENETGTIDFAAEKPGVYRVEAWVLVDGERRPWIYSNPVYVR